MNTTSLAPDETSGTLRPAVLYANLKGGLGNQMFQYAFCLTMARRLGMKLKLAHAGWVRSFALGLFGLSQVKMHPPRQGIIQCDDDYHPGMPAEIADRISRSGGATAWVEGYFQNENLFLPEEEAVRRAFSLPRIALPIPESQTPVCVSVRTGDDFINNPKHSVCTPKYYQDAINLVRDLVPQPLFFIFSDVPERSSAFVQEAPDVVFLPFVEGDAFRRMLGCQAFVIPNSTFSWWAAWLSGAELVVSPDRFLNSTPWDIIPSRWKTIPC